MVEYIYVDDGFGFDEDEVSLGFMRKYCKTLIRCKDCKWYTPPILGRRYGSCWLYSRAPAPTAYCDMAERKEE